MRNIFIVVLAFLSTSAFAFGDQGQAQGQLQGQAQGQIQGQAQGQGQAQFSNADSRSRALSYSAALNRSEQNVSVTPAPVALTVNEARIPENTRNEQAGTVNVRSVPNVFGGNVYPTTNCAHSSTIGASGLGWGVSVGSSYLDEECSLRETSRSFAGMGMKDDALHVLCSSKFASAAPSCKAISQAQGAPRPEQQ